MHNISFNVLWSQLGHFVWRSLGTSLRLNSSLENFPDTTWIGVLITQKKRCYRYAQV